MAFTPIQFQPGGAINKDIATKLAVRTSLAQTAVGASAIVNLPTMTVTGDDEAAFVVLNTDATAGSMVVTLEHDSDGVGTFVALETGLQLGGERAVQDALTSLTVDMTDTDNQGTILVNILPTARQLLVNGTLVQNIREAFRLVLTTDAGWNGTAADTVMITGERRHKPSGVPGA